MVQIANPFKPAKKQQLKARIALDGPTGAGKTWTALEIATELAGDGTIAVIDTEKNSGLLYANKFKFDHMNFTEPYEPERLVETLKAAEESGYAVVVIDSFSHFWEGEGGMLDVVDAAAAKAYGNTFAGWKVGTPIYRWVIDTILKLDMHVIVCMRSKMSYEIEEYIDTKGNKKSKPVKLGLKPVQREGVEYEFTVVGDLDIDHKLIISKSRCDEIADKVYGPHRASDMAKTFAAWLNDGEERITPKEADELLNEIKELEPTDQEELKTWMKAQNLVIKKLMPEERDEVQDQIDRIVAERLQSDKELTEQDELISK